MRHALDILYEHFNDRPDFIQSDDDGPERTLSIARPLRYDTTIEIPLKMPTESSDSRESSDDQKRSSGQSYKCYENLMHRQMSFRDIVKWFENITSRVIKITTINGRNFDVIEREIPECCICGVEDSDASDSDIGDSDYSDIENSDIDDDGSSDIGDSKVNAINDGSSDIGDSDIYNEGSSDIEENDNDDFSDIEEDDNNGFSESGEPGDSKYNNLGDNGDNKTINNSVASNNNNNLTINNNNSVDPIDANDNDIDNIQNKPYSYSYCLECNSRYCHNCFAKSLCIIGHAWSKRRYFDGNRFCDLCRKRISLKRYCDNDDYDVCNDCWFSEDNKAALECKTGLLKLRDLELHYNNCNFGSLFDWIPILGSANFSSGDNKSDNADNKGTYYILLNCNSLSRWHKYFALVIPSGGSGSGSGIIIQTIFDRSLITLDNIFETLHKLNNQEFYQGLAILKLYHSL